MTRWRDRGSDYAVSNAEGGEAMKLVRDTVGIDLDPAAAIATAALLQAVQGGNVGQADRILLNLTGGGLREVREDLGFTPLKPLNG